MKYLVLFLLLLLSFVTDSSAQSINDPFIEAEKFSAQNKNLVSSAKSGSTFYAARIDSVLYIASKYDSANDIIYTFDKCMANELFTFRYVALYSNTANSIDENVTRPYSTMILNADKTDNIGPVGLLIDQVGYWIGGNHLFTDSLGVNHKTAQTTSIQIMINGSIQNDDFEMYSDTLKINVENSLYYPTSLPEQVECIYENVEYTINKSGINVNLSHDILENMMIVVYYGLQTVYNTSLQKKIFIHNSQHLDELDFINGIYSGIISDYPDVYKVRLSNLDKSICQEMVLDPSQGLFVETSTYVNSTASFSRIFTSSGKTYFTQIRNKNVITGESYFWKGRYSWYNNNEFSILPPENINIISNLTGNVIRWNDSVSATSYSIKRSADPYSGFVEIGTSTVPSYTDTEISASTRYFYKVTAINNNP